MPNNTYEKQIGPQVTKKCWNIGPKRLQIGLPNFMVFFFQPWGPIQGHNVFDLVEYLIFKINK
jgi:hypothetical protein